MRMLQAAAKVFLGLLAVALLVLVAVPLWFGWQAGQRETHEAESLAPASGRYVGAAGLNIFIQETGRADDPAVLLVHGTGAWSEAWKPTMRVLASAGFRAVAIDLPPFGFSQRPVDADYRKATQGQRIIAVLDALKIRKVILVGHSFGGGPTMEAALQMPDRVRGVVLVDAALSVDAANENRAAHAPAGGLAGFLLSTPPLRDRVVATFLTNPLFTRKLLAMFIDNPAHATDAWVEVYRRPLSALGTTPAISRWLPELLSPAPVSTSEKPSTYRKLTTPLRLIWGERDSITPLSQAQAIVALAPGTKLAVIKGVGHIPQIEDGAGFNALLLATLTQMP